MRVRSSRGGLDSCGQNFVQVSFLRVALLIGMNRERETVTDCFVLCNCTDL